MRSNKKSVEWAAANAARELGAVWRIQHGNARNGVSWYVTFTWKSGKHATVNCGRSLNAAELFLLGMARGADFRNVYA